jgi:pimeloyl-ACP methyl ester carboxylesterase
VPVMLVRGAESRFVRDADADRFRAAQPGLRVEVVRDAGHAIQSDQPLALTRLIEQFAFA